VADVDRLDEPLRLEVVEGELVADGRTRLVHEVPRLKKQKKKRKKRKKEKRK
jgi:hypothetical protein